VDGYFLPKTPAQIFAAHEQNDVPAIVGFTHDESSNALRTAKSLAEYQETARRLYGNDADTFLKLYPASTDEEAHAMGSAAAREGAIENSRRKMGDGAVEIRQGAGIRFHVLPRPSIYSRRGDRRSRYRHHRRVPQSNQLYAACGMGMFRGMIVGVTLPGTH
jgi:hypothetical protein